MPFLPSGPWSPSGYHCASYYLLLALGSQHGCVAQAAFGEGARVANRLDFVSYRSEKFTVDARGYRNPPLAQLTPKVILAGSSFSLGLSLNDGDTLAGQLNRRLGPVVYNASKVLNPALSAGLAIESAREIGMERGWVLLELLNRAAYQYAGPQAGVAAGFRARILRAAAPLQSFERRVKDPFALSRLTAMVNMRLQNDSLLPNPDRWRFAEEELSNGRRMLFYLDDVKFFAAPHGLEETVQSVTRIREDLLKRNLRLAVVLIPSGYSVYWPLLRNGGSGVDSGEAYMTALAGQLDASGIPVLNCLPRLREAAARELAGGGLVYWPDDAHWNPKGVAVAADAIAPWLGKLIAAN
jgi:hypothetical protein